MFKSGKKKCTTCCFIKINRRNIWILHKKDPDPVKMEPDPPIVGCVKLWFSHDYCFVISVFIGDLLTVGTFFPSKMLKNLRRLHSHKKQ